MREINMDLIDQKIFHQAQEKADSLNHQRCIEANQFNQDHPNGVLRKEPILVTARDVLERNY